jgi:hypothetical protein
MPSGTQDRTLNGHVFIPEVLVRSPFAATTVRENLVYGSGEAKGAATAGNLVLQETTYEFSMVDLLISYEHKLAEGISAGVAMTADVISGTDGKSVLVMGSQLGYGVLGTFTAGKEFGPVRAAFTADVAYGPKYGLFFMAVLDKAFNGVPLDLLKAEDLAFSSDNAWTLKPGASVAWAPMRQLGVVAALDYQWISQKTSSGTNTGSAFDLGVAADWDFGTYTKAPVALLASWHWTAPQGSSVDLSHIIDWSIGVYYTGRPALAMGLELGQRYFTYRSLDSTVGTAQVRLQYFW